MNKLILDGHKLDYHQDRVQAWLSGERTAPITIDMALTRACTYKCVYCYGQLQNNDIKLMTRDVIFRALDDFAEIGVKAVSFISDGESTCSPHLTAAVLRAKMNGLDVALGTNGAMLKYEDIFDMLPSLTYLRFNISAADSKSYARIHGCKEQDFFEVKKKIDSAVRTKKLYKLNTTIGLQMVLMPEFADQIIPLTKLGKELGVDYLVIKHCSDDENGALGVVYKRYEDLADILHEAESYSTDTYQVSAKWSKIMSLGKRSYERCYGSPFIMQLSGSGLVAPCGMLFNDKYKKYHIGNIVDTSFKELWKSERYWEVINELASDRFNAKIMCGSLCLQHKVNEYLDRLKQKPQHINFI
jgi:MoaA/NifB/PqqE/SkfB family radical SAM enzyme